MQFRAGQQGFGGQQQGFGGGGFGQQQGGFQAGGFGQQAPQQQSGFGGSPGGFSAGAGTPGANSNSTDHAVQQAPTDCISHLTFSPKGCPKVLLSATSWDKTVRIWELQGNNGVSSQPLAMQQHSAPLLSSALSSDGRVFYGGCCNTVMMYNLTGGQPTQVAAHQQPVSCVRYVETANNGPMLITGGWDGKLHFWDLKSQQPAKTEDLGAPIVSMCSKTPPMLAVLLSRKLVMYNLNTFQRQEDQPNQYIKFGMRDVACVEDGSGFLVGSVCGRAAFHSLNPTALQSYCYKAHVLDKSAHSEVYPINTVCAIKGTYITGGSDGAIRLWNIKSKQRVTEFAPHMAGTTPVPIAAADIHTDTQLYAYAASYDWSLGKDGYSPQGPFGIFVKTLSNSFIK